MDLRKIWEQRAKQWRDWARTPGHDAFWAYSASFFEDIVPTAPGRVLDIGCGEGRVTRALAERADAVVGIDSSPTLVRDAAGADEVASYLVGDAIRLPFRNRSFDTVVAYNSLMDLNDMPEGIAEASRVLKTDGRFCICVVHPIQDAGGFTSDEADAPFEIENYLESRHYEDHFERDGLEMTFSSWRYPLAQYVDSVEAAGLLIERLKEPLPDLSKKPDLKRLERIPMFLFLRALKP
ncbi:MAG TPA: class I SAM-dependent methyltransferase [Actinomycetota bacterium]|nr:class I SAM-dependent methyltransferase [Actinomycetota bacterium]